jgi:hypothetical protein
MTTQDPNHPIDSGSQVAPWSGEPANTAGSQDTELVAGHGSPTSNEAKAAIAQDHSYTDGATVDTEGIYQSPGYSLGAQEDDATNPSTIHPNTNSGQAGVPYAKYDGTTNGAVAKDAVVPGDTEFAYGHGYNPATDNNKAIPPTQPGAKQPDIDATTKYVGDTDAGPNGQLDTNPWATGYPGGGVGGLSGNEVPLNTGLYASFYGQTNNASQVLDTTNTSNPTALPANNGTALGSQTALDLTGGTGHYVETSNIDAAYPGLTAGLGVTAPGKPTGVSWTFHAGSAEVSWNAPVLPAPVQANTVVTTSDAGVFGSTGTYFYVVTATDLLGETVVSNEKSAVIAATTSSATISWGAVTGATGYKVYRGTGAGLENRLIATITSGSTLSFKDRGAAGTVAALPASNTAVNGGGGHIREYVVYGWRVRGAAKLPANDAAADAYLTNGILPTVTAHSRGVTEYKADGTTIVKVPQTRVRVEHLEPGEYYYFRVAARNEAATGALSAITGVTYPTAPAIPAYYLSAVDIDGNPVVVPGSTLPEGESLAAMTFTGEHGIDDDGVNLTGQSVGQLAEPGEEDEDRV